MHNVSSLKSSTRQMPHLNFCSRGASVCLTFKDFVQSSYVTNTPRGEFIADMKTLSNAGVLPPVIFSWNDFYSFLAYHHRTSPEAVAVARKVWQQFRSKSKPTVSPVTTQRDSA
jgi:hypothetical protein